MRPGAVRHAYAVLLLLAGCAAAPPAPVRHPSDPDALWRIVSTRCLAEAPRPPDCAAVWSDPARRAVLLKDRHGSFQYLLVPSVRVSGIEDPALLRADAPNYFASAWDARSFVAQALQRPLPRQYVSLALNSPHGRSQDQLHIHIDCLRPDVYAALQRQRTEIGPEWRALAEPLLGHVYLARTLEGTALEQDPIRLLADALPADASLRDYSLVVAGAQLQDGRPGFVLLATRQDARSGNCASGEEVQDHACGLVTGATQVLPGVR
ncbi:MULTISPECIES: CDP-diacylglycerol diphosphatase [Xanthomonas]|uniref:CDP-diacylglycerol diphosphatase n=1 Tax=Xanthomonas TaxID=338 RepID=UPI000E1EBD00|nr:MULTISPECIES: CDP-diacylglycerol diphosphatase [Xanthomonas]